jgi:transposase
MDPMALRELADVLDIAGLRVTGYEKGPDDLLVSVELEKDSANCPTCGVRSSRRHSQKRTPVRDLPCFGRRVLLLLPRRRFKCRPCGRPFTEAVPFVEFGTSFTKRYEQYVFEQCYERSQATVASQEGISDTVVRKVYETHASAAIEPRGRPAAIRVLGIDEIATKKGHRDFACIITDIDRSRVIEVLENRLKTTVCAYLTSLPASVKKSLEWVSIDMWEGYYQAVVETLPKRVKVVIDRFHVMKQLNGALTKSRRELQRGMTSKEERDDLKGLRWLLVTNECNLNAEEKEKLAALCTTCPELKACYDLKEEFRKIFDDETSRTAAKARLDSWKERVKATGLKSLDRFLGTLANWEEWILNYFSSGKVTNGVVEGLNNKIKLIKRRGYGYTHNGNFRQRILIECGR